MTQRKGKTGICKYVVIATVVAIRDVVKNGFHCTASRQASRFRSGTTTKKRTLLCGTFGNGGTMGGTYTFMFFFCRRGKAGGDNNMLLRDESIESCLTE